MISEINLKGNVKNIGITNTELLVSYLFVKIFEEIPFFSFLFLWANLGRGLNNFCSVV